jgi:hypothetical protein
MAYDIQAMLQILVNSGMPVDQAVEYLIATNPLQAERYLAGLPGWPTGNVLAGSNGMGMPDDQNVLESAINESVGTTPALQQDFSQDVTRQLSPSYGQPDYIPRSGARQSLPKDDEDTYAGAFGLNAPAPEESTLDTILAALQDQGMSLNEAYAWLAQSGYLGTEWSGSQLADASHGVWSGDTFGYGNAGNTSGELTDFDYAAPFSSSGLTTMPSDTGSGINTGKPITNLTRPPLPLTQPALAGGPPPQMMDDPQTRASLEDLYGDMQDSATQRSIDYQGRDFRPHNDTVMANSLAEETVILRMLIDSGMPVDDALAYFSEMDQSPAGRSTLRDQQRGGPALDYMLNRLTDRTPEMRPISDVSISGPTHLQNNDNSGMQSVSPPGMLDFSDFNNPGIGFGSVPTPMRGVGGMNQGAAFYPQSAGFNTIDDRTAMRGQLQSGVNVGSTAGDALTGDPGIFDNPVPYEHQIYNDPRYVGDAGSGERESGKAFGMQNADREAANRDASRDANDILAYLLEKAMTAGRPTQGLQQAVSSQAKSTAPPGRAPAATQVRTAALKSNPPTTRARTVVAPKPAPKPSYRPPVVIAKPAYAPPPARATVAPRPAPYYPPVTAPRPTLIQAVANNAKPTSALLKAPR